MAEKYYTAASGNWSTAANWNGGTKPTNSDDVYANGKTITIDEDVTVLSLRTTAGTTAVAGGNFTCSTNRTITVSGSGIVAGSSECLTFSGTTGSIVGNVTGGSGGNARGVRNSSSGTLTITGNVTGGSGGTGTGHGAYNGTGTLAIVGNVTGGSDGSSGVYGFSAGTLTVTGNVTGGSASSSYGVRVPSGTLTVTGNVTGGSNSTAFGVFNEGSGTTTVNGNLTPATSCAVGIDGSGRITVTGNLNSVSTGVAPIGSAGIRFTIDPSATLTHAYRVQNGGSIGSERTLSTSTGGGSYVIGG